MENKKTSPACNKDTGSKRQLHLFIVRGSGHIGCALSVSVLQCVWQASYSSEDLLTGTESTFVPAGQKAPLKSS